MPRAEPPQRQRLIVEVPAGVSARALAAALAGGDVAAVVLAEDGARTAALVEAAQLEGVAALVAHVPAAGGAPAWPLGYGADGVHVIGDEASARRIVLARPDGATVGAVADGRHVAMTIGEAGADYVWFGSTAALTDETLENACWWQALFEVPAVAAGPADMESVRRLIATRVEFIAVTVFDAADPAALVERINDEIDAAPGGR